jgi:predicted phosphodiesterase
MIELHADRSIVIGVVADTHVPDRVNALHPDLLQELATREVDYIFHAGDCSTSCVLDELRAIAPVFAVAGNRDWFLPTLPRHRLFPHQRRRSASHARAGQRLALLDR